MERNLIVGVILAGGQSRRMGTDKAFLEFEGLSLIARITETLRPLFSTVAIVAKKLERFRNLKEVHLVQDLFPEQHPLGGICTALHHFRGKDCFVFACDLPFLNPPLIRAMIQNRKADAVLVPRSRRGLEPLHAIYPATLLNLLTLQMQGERGSLEAILKKLPMSVLDTEILHTYDPAELSFLNMNTPEEFRNFNYLNKL